MNCLDDILFVDLDVELALEATADDLDYVDLITDEDVDKICGGGIDYEID